MLKTVKRPARLSIILLAVIILLIFLHYSTLLRPIENIVIRIFSPIQNKVYVLGVKVNNFYNVTRFQRDLLEANLELEEKVEKLIIENAQLKTELTITQKLEEQQDFITESGMEAVSAKIIGKNLQSDFQTLIINKGSEDGILVGLPVIIQQGVIIGKVVEVNRNNSQLILINDSYSSLAATIQNQNQTKGVVVGDRGLSLKMELIPQDELIQVGDVVVTSGLETNIAAGLVIGQIEQIISEPNNFFQQAYLKPLTDFNDLIVVSILKSNRK